MEDRVKTLDYCTKENVPRRSNRGCFIAFWVALVMVILLIVLLVASMLRGAYSALTMKGS